MGVWQRAGPKVCVANFGIDASAAGINAEMPNTGKYHRNAVFVGGGNHFGIAHRTAGLDHRLDAGFGGGVDAVAEREKRITGHHRSGHDQARIGGFDAGDARRIHAAHLAGAHANGAAVFGIHNRVGFDELGDLPRKQQVGKLRVGGCKLTDHFQCVTGDDTGIGGLQQHAGVHPFAVDETGGWWRQRGMRNTRTLAFFFA